MQMLGESLGLVVKADGSWSRGRGFEPGTVYCMDVSDASYYINSHTKIMKIKVAKRGTPKKYFFNNMQMFIYFLTIYSIISKGIQGGQNSDDTIFNRKKIELTFLCLICPTLDCDRLLVLNRH